MTNLAGHDMESVLEAFHAAKSDAPHCFVAYTIKGMGLPLAGHKDNHAGLMTPDQMEAFRTAMGIEPGREWDRFAGLAYDEQALLSFLEDVPLARAKPAAPPPSAVAVAPIAAPAAETMSTQEAFGRIMTELGKREDELGRRIVTTSPDVTVSTSLGGWVNHKRLFSRESQQDVFRLEGVPSPQRWGKRPEGQHIELGIAENNLFLLLSALGLSDRLFGQRLLPIGTLYDPFIARGLDALTYGCYADARFMVIGTPSGISLAPEGGAHQSVTTPLIGLGQPGLTAFEPAFADELAVLMEWGFGHMQAKKGGSVYLRLSTRPIRQPARPMTEDLRDAVLAGGYWLREPAPGADLAVVYTGVVAPEALEAFEQIREDIPGAGLLAVTSADRLYAGWQAARRARAHGGGRPATIETLLGRLAPDAALISVIDGHPATLAWIGGVGRHRVHPLGVERFGQSGDIPDLYRLHGIDAAAILDAAATACLERLNGIR
jgi:pyruvate dehydrogenase E1 component